MLEMNISMLLEQIEKTFEGHIQYYNSALHGLDHLRQVSQLAGKIASVCGVDVESAMLAGFLHDAGRTDDFGGNEHALDSAILARPLLIRPYPRVDVDKVCYAISRHADGMTTDDPLIGSLWDADRLLLRRLRMTVNPRLLSTAEGKRILMEWEDCE
jgi:uncharacterized protein